MSDQSCIFCRIVKGEIPTNKVFEDEYFLAMLDINPRSPGHVQVIPKEHYRWVWDVPNAGAYFEVVRKIAMAQKKAFGSDMILCNIIGEEVPHAHVWVYPDPSTAQGDKKDIAGNAEKIKRSL